MTIFTILTQLQQCFEKSKESAESKIVSVSNSIKFVLHWQRNYRVIEGLYWLEASHELFTTGDKSRFDLDFIPTVFIRLKRFIFAIKIRLWRPRTDVHR